MKFLMLLALVSCASTPTEEKVVCAKVFDKDTKKESTLCMKESERNKFVYGEQKPRRIRFGKNRH